MKINAKLLVKLGLAAAIACLSVGCGADNTPGIFNPYDEAPESRLGDRDNKAILGESGGSDADLARHSLEVMGSYRRAQDPQPYYPVLQPAEVRLMWVPDHLNRSGDLVPAHYYYLKVRDDAWAVQDAFELERQIDPEGESSAVPYIVK